MTYLALDRVVLLLRVAAAAGVGALAATVVTARTRTFTHPWLLDLTAVIVTVLCVVGVAMLTSDLEAVQRTNPRRSGVPVPIGGQLSNNGNSLPPHPDFRPPVLGYDAPPRPAGDSYSDDSRRSVSGQDDLAASAAAPSWYEAAARGVAGQPALPPTRSTAEPQSAAPTSPAARSVPAHLAISIGGSSGHADLVRQIVQCPRCGAFDLEVHRLRGGCDFTCRDCMHPWRWRTGAPGPVVVVRPKLAHPPSPSADPAGAPVWHLNSPRSS